MITGTHAIGYARDPGQARAFFRDVLGLPNLDAHDGWLTAPVTQTRWGRLTGGPARLILAVRYRAGLERDG